MVIPKKKKLNITCIQKSRMPYDVWQKAQLNFLLKDAARPSLFKNLYRSPSYQHLQSPFLPTPSSPSSQHHQPLSSHYNRLIIFETTVSFSTSHTLSDRNEVFTMIQLPSFTQALGLLATAPLAFAQSATSPHGVMKSQDMFATDTSIELKTGWPWDATSDDAFGHFPSSSTLGANVACQSDTPLGAGPVPSPDTATAFSAYGPFSGNATANGVNGTTYTVVTVNSNGATIPTSSDTTPINYLGWVNMASYSASSCASLCAAYGTGSTCRSFNTYYLRSPTVAPSFNSSCPNPPSMYE